MICKLRQESPRDKLVSVSSGQQVHLRLYHWVPQKSVLSTHMPRLFWVLASFYWLTIKTNIWFTREQRNFVSDPLEQTLGHENIQTKATRVEPLFQIGKVMSEGWKQIITVFRRISEISVISIHPDIWQKVTVWQVIIDIYLEYKGAKDRTLRHSTMYKAIIRIDIVYHWIWVLGLTHI